MNERRLDLTDFWYSEFVRNDLCGLCGNSGAIDTRGRAVSAAGVHAGAIFYCICPNGRAWKAGGVPISELHTSPAPALREAADALASAIERENGVIERMKREGCCSDCGKPTTCRQCIGDED